MNRKREICSAIKSSMLFLLFITSQNALTYSQLKSFIKRNAHANTHAHIRALPFLQYKVLQRFTLFNSYNRVNKERKRGKINNK